MTLIATEHERFHTFEQVSFGGVACAQIFADFYVWEGVLNDRTRTDEEGFPPIESIVELGTYKGGFSLFLAAQAVVRGLTFRTYDVVHPGRKVPGFVQLDVFAKADQVVQHLGRHEPLILLCDGGNKPRELETFGAALGEGSVAAVHDWGNEIDEDDVPEGMNMIYQDYCEELGSATRFFQRG